MLAVVWRRWGVLVLTVLAVSVPASGSPLTNSPESTMSLVNVPYSPMSPLRSASGSAAQFAGLL